MKMTKTKNGVTLRLSTREASLLRDIADVVEHGRGDYGKLAACLFASIPNGGYLGSVDRVPIFPWSSHPQLKKLRGSRFGRFPGMAVGE